MNISMTLRHLSVFLAVCEENSMTGAAKRLHMTQPSVSQTIKELEDAYEVCLFERLGRRLHITPAGQSLLAYGRQILSLTAQAEQALHSFSRTAPVRIGASVTIGEVFLVELLQQLKSRHPAQEILSEIHNTSELEHMLLRDDIDLALVEGDISSPYLLSSPFMVDELVVVAPPSCPLAQRTSLSVQELCSLTMYLREEGSGTRDLFLQTMEQHHAAVHIAGSFNNTEALKKIVMAGLGATILSRRLVTEDVAAGRLALLPVDRVAFKRIFKIVRHKDKFITPPLQAVIQACQQHDQWF